MLISETDLYKREWLSLVFKNRNQQYGAYELRSHYANVMSGAMGITFFIVAAFGITTTLISRSTHTTADPLIHVTHVDNTLHVMPPHPHEEKPEKPAPAKPAAKRTLGATQRFVEPKVVPNEQAENIKVLDPNVAVGPANVEATGKADYVPVIDEPVGVPGGTGTGIDNSIHDGNGVGLDVLPQPVGGENAWAKFLQKNLRYPPVAQEQGAQGRVYMSFIIEKDGHLSNIIVERKAGFGFDEEALRVLKLAPAWKPGMQNSQPVRVKYTIPLNFQLGDQ